MSEVMSALLAYYMNRGKFNRFAISGCRANSVAAVLSFACRACLTAYP